MADRFLEGGKKVRVEENPNLPGMEGDLAEKQASRRPVLTGLTNIGRTLGRRFTSDAGLVTAGVALAVVCAVFPWYIFIHQEQFGIRPLEFEGSEITPAAPAGKQPEPIGARIAAQEFEPLGLDAIPTGTVDREAAPAAAPLSEQPFPGETATFRLVYVAGGRAMIEDGSGFWVVQQGSGLPDGSRVAAIEKRAGDWVLVTSRQRVVPLTP